jgi:diacylglycerol kinase family enzyme
VGAYATFVRTRDRLERRLGYWLASIVAALRILARLRTVRVTLEVEGVEREYDTPLVFVGVGERELKLPTLGNRLPEGHRGLHVMVVKTRGGARMLAFALAAAARGIPSVSTTPSLDAFLVDAVRIELRRRVKAVRIGVDGEIVSAAPTLEYRLRRDAVRVVVASPEEPAAAAD